MPWQAVSNIGTLAQGLANYINDNKLALFINSDYVTTDVDYLEELNR